MYKALAPLVALCVLAGCGGPTAEGNYSFEAQSEAAKAALPGADKIILSVKPGGEVTLDAGPMNLLTTTWKQEGDKVSFGKGQGLVGAEYRLKEGSLVPLKDGQEVTEWRFKKK